MNMHLIAAVVIVEIFAKLTGSMLMGLFIFGCMELLSHYYLENNK